MKLWQGIAAATVLTLGLHADPRDAKSTHALLKNGAGLSTKVAKELESFLEKHPDDEESRIRLLSYYSAVPAGADLSAVKAARLSHILWLIKNDPKDGLGLFKLATGVYRLHCQGDDLADPAAFQRAAEEWLEQVRSHPRDAEIRQGAVNAIQFCSPE